MSTCDARAAAKTRRACARSCWRPPRRTTAAASAAIPAAIPATAEQSTPTAPVPPSPAPLHLVINLARRADLLAALQRLPLGVPWERLDAVDGRSLTWDSIGAMGALHADALREARWAESEDVPTICRRTGSFSPHFTIGSVGCALSHRKAWETLAASPTSDWALILEDDVSRVAKDFQRQLRRLVKALPATWRLVYLGFHESTGQLLPSAAMPSFVEIPKQSAVTGLFGYLLHQRGAATLLAPLAIFPLRYQVDVAVSNGGLWPVGTRFAIHPEAVLLASPKSEEGACDTDVQSLGHPAKQAHRNLPQTMLRL